MLFGGVEKGKMQMHIKLQRLRHTGVDLKIHRSRFGERAETNMMFKHLEERTRVEMVNEETPVRRLSFVH